AGFLRTPLDGDRYLFVAKTFGLCVDPRRHPRPLQWAPCSFSVAGFFLTPYSTTESSSSRIKRFSRERLRFFDFGWNEDINFNDCDYSVFLKTVVLGPSLILAPGPRSGTV